jgi:hypothetical protein
LGKSSTADVGYEEQENLAVPANPISLKENSMATTAIETPSTLKEKVRDWTKPAAMAIPKEGYLSLENGRYGPVYPRTPACYGFTIIAKIKPGRGHDPCLRQDYRGSDRRYTGRTCDSETALPAVGSLQYREDTYFMYQGIFDTDFDKYTEDAVALFKTVGVNTVFENLEGFPEEGGLCSLEAWPVFWDAPQCC